jgi:hypothetical protein
MAGADREKTPAGALGRTAGVIVRSGSTRWADAASPPRERTLLGVATDRQRLHSGHWRAELPCAVARLTHAARPCRV